jgi:methylated-DNA-[protein]-cysteine S-methyltransferase
MPQLSVDSPLGRLCLVEEDGRLTAVHWRGNVARSQETPLLIEAKAQLEAYFAGRRTAFDLPLAPRGAPFELSVWRLMSAIPYGETRRYGELAAALAATARDVGQACGSNPLPIFIPCHRVLAAGGALGGYSGGKGTETKRQLLVLEGALLI